jgi:hypothetical protein
MTIEMTKNVEKSIPDAIEIILQLAKKLHQKMN